jgi:halocyanin-like protein
MQPDSGLGRRTVLRATGTLLATGVLAGCTDDDGDDGDDTNYENVPEEEEPDYEGWLDAAEGYDGTADGRGESEVEVAVGAGGQGYAFDPPAILVEPGTTVVWRWTGNGGGHNVVEENEAFGDDEIHVDEGHTYEHTFEEPGTYRYVCTPHDAQGMRGAVAVEE